MGQVNFLRLFFRFFLPFPFFDCSKYFLQYTNTHGSDTLAGFLCAYLRQNPIKRLRLRLLEVPTEITHTPRVTNTHEWQERTETEDGGLPLNRSPSCACVTFSQWKASCSRTFAANWNPKVAESCCWRFSESCLLLVAVASWVAANIAGDEPKKKH